MMPRSRGSNTATCGIHRQSGLTLVELMVALVAGVFLIGGALQVFMSGKRAYAEVDRITTLNENLRFTTDYMTRDIRPAGLEFDPGPPESRGFNLAGGLEPGELDASGATNTITVRKFGTNCLGQSGNWVTSAYSVNADNELVCSDGATSPPLVNGVLSMSVVARDENGDENAAAWNDPVALRFTLVMQSGTGNMPRRNHTVVFIVALRNAIYAKYGEV